mmetsp:Transcript_2269/g.6779  ORF Transcript_2269/g.6779 Transcript_2269/m.6779 type:complete len:440 (-) Transcript_2269:798-2117(-)|eukprot:CAMPEP_0198729696 /NCGR_PEP_ID=MMETSP1475-20131203/20525_1 /TAXON_ID= ORGANISM="Unidentified sp., Strain CCMP1999" /NCGR_SAMPLE_ID=MMETSP1475 /ASSEMBLY_ACC=CAM_ASM_001111 /LENGTH=439 /DNA_ID=CAMNT_0044492397 /DNA_START=86 /DNA_END=1405 /DNA_ORIENTATION=+
MALAFAVVCAKRAANEKPGRQEKPRKKPTRYARARITVSRGVYSIKPRRRAAAPVLREGKEKRAKENRGRAERKVQEKTDDPDKSQPDLFLTLERLQRPKNSDTRKVLSNSLQSSQRNIIAAVRLQPRTVRTFVVHPKPKAFDLVRRPWKGDPIVSVAELRHTVVRPDTSSARRCSDPRAVGGLKDWVRSARKWGIVDTDVNEQKLVDQYAVRPESSSRVIVIGDVHGCIDELEKLLKLVSFAPGDQVIFLGDLVAKGPASLEVLQLAREMNARAVRGNHDHKVITWRVAKQKTQELVRSIPVEHQKIAESLPEVDFQWMLGNPWFMTYPEMSMLFVHAGFEPNVPLARQRPHMLMNMRSIASSGKPTTRRGTESWAKHWTGPETVLFGHDATRGIQRHEKAIGLDSACVHGGWLTALILPEKKMISVPARRKYKQLHV